MVALRYSTTTSAVSRPNALVARSLACWLSLPGGVKPPPDLSDPNTPVPQTAAPATAITAASSTSRRRRKIKRPHASNTGTSAARLLPAVHLDKRCKLRTVLTSHTAFRFVKRVQRFLRFRGGPRGTGTEPARPRARRHHRGDQGHGAAAAGGRGAGGGLAAGHRPRHGDDRARALPLLRQPREPARARMRG